MNSTGAEPRFIEPGDDQGEYLDLPIYVTRQVDEETRRSLAACKRLLVASMPADNAEDASENG